MNKLSISHLICCLVGLTLAACGDSSGENQSVPHSQRGFSQPFLPVGQSGEKISLKNLGTTEINKIAACEETSMETRLDSKAFAVSHSKVDRYKQSIQMPVGVRAEKHNYQTETEGQLYTKGYQLIELSMGGQSSLQQGAYAFTDTCTLSAGCDMEKRVYEIGSAWTKVVAETQMQKMVSDLNEDIANYNCTYRQDPEVSPLPPTLSKVEVLLFGELRPAIEYLEEQTVLVSCQGEEVGEGSLVKREIVLADQLPQLGEFNTTSIAGKSIGCSRTKVFSGYQVTFNGQILEGSSNEITEFSVEGTIQSADEWNEYKNNKKALQAAVNEAQARVNRAQSERDNANSEVAKKRRELSQAKEEEQAALNTLDKLNNNPEATQPEIKAAETDYNNKSLAVKKIQVTFEDAQDALQAAERSLESAKVTLRDSQAALATFLEENER